MRIHHTAIENNWNINQVITNSNTLILGSFNPFNDNGINTDYYYGRSTNYLWKVIAEETGRDSNYFFNNLSLKLEIMIEKKFCFLDIIDSIDISTINNQVEGEFIERKIFNEYSDQVLFTTNQTFNTHNVRVTRNYNQSIIPMINESSINKIIHTMGNNRINLNLRTTPQENNLGFNGFQGFINSIINRGIEFVPESYSPGGRAVRTGGNEYYNSLRQWLNQHLLLS